MVEQAAVQIKTVGEAEALAETQATAHRQSYFGAVAVRHHRIGEAHHQAVIAGAASAAAEISAAAVPAETGSSILDFRFWIEYLTLDLRLQTLEQLE